MADNTRDLSQIGNLHAGTLRLLTIATEIGDDFLQYIYRMALRDLEEKSVSVSNRFGSESKRSDRTCGASHDPAIVELAAQLRALASRKH